MMMMMIMKKFVRYLIENTSRLKAIINIHTALYYFGKKRIFSGAWMEDLNNFSEYQTELKRQQQKN